MRYIRALAFAAIVVPAVIALIGVSSASATSTALCKMHEEPCASGNQVKNVHMVANDLTFATSILTMLCEKSLLLGSVGSLGAPQKIFVSELTWTNCKTVGSATNNCTFSNFVLPTVDVLQTSLNLGAAALLGFKSLFICTSVPVLGTADCTAEAIEIPGLPIEGALHQLGTGHGMLTASKLSIPLTGMFCPSTGKLTALYEPLEHNYLVS